MEFWWEGVSTNLFVYILRSAFVCNFEELLGYNTRNKYNLVTLFQKSVLHVYLDRQGKKYIIFFYNYRNIDRWSPSSVEPTLFEAASPYITLDY